MTEAGVLSGAPATHTLDRVTAYVKSPVDIAWLAAFRFCFGTLMAVSMVRFLAYGWVDSFFIKPRFHFKYWGFDWVQALPASGMHAVFWLLLVSACGIALGLAFRLACSLFVVAFGYVQLIDVTNYLNHYYLAWLLSLLLLLSPAATVWSIDAWVKSKRALQPRSTPAHTLAFGWLLVFRVQVGVVYVYAGLAKAHRDWLVDAQPLRIWLGSRTDLPVLGSVFTWDGMPTLMSWAGFLFDTVVVGFLLWRRTRLLAYSCVIVFHTVTRTLFPIGMFSSIMVLAALVFFPPDWPRVLLSKVLRKRQVRWLQPARGPSASTSGRGTRGVWMAAASLYCTWQVLMPLRFLAYGGDVRWHEQGMRFSWRVMVREKNGSVTFLVRDPRTAREFTVAPRAYLTRLQEREMSSQPDLILQLAHRIRDDYAQLWDGPVEVRAEALVSLNGRALAPMVDASVDLSQVSDGLAHYTWVLPAPTTRPPRVRPV